MNPSLEGSLSCDTNVCPYFAIYHGIWCEISPLLVCSEIKISGNQSLQLEKNTKCNFPLI